MKDDKPSVWRNIIFFCLPFAGALIAAPFLASLPVVLIIGLLALMEFRLSDSRRNKTAALCACVSSVILCFYFLAFPFIRV